MIRQVYAETRYEPAEFEYTNPMECWKCGREHDLDEGEEFRYLLLPDGTEGVLCDTCRVWCKECDGQVLECGRAHPVIWMVMEGVKVKGDEMICSECLRKREVEAILGYLPSYRGNGK